MKVHRSLTAQQQEKTVAIAQLRDWITPGDTVYTILDHVSRSGLSRVIRVVVPIIGPSASLMHRSPLLREVEFRHPNHAVGLALGLRHARRNGHQQDGLVISGGGMDMGFSLVYQLSSVLYGCGNGYACLGDGCPSNVHVNARAHRVEDACGDGVFHTDGYALRHRWL